MTKKIFVNTEEEFDNLMCKYNLEDCGMSGDYPGWHWFADDEADVYVYYKFFYNGR